ncbi:hypothetical protein PR202_ga13892 [Eleusine coracana subsp. coracana]|uniref:Uncharacterized protein n=1 Tax=Eleusine coracana subsp. coracana TaxID=191504 RepID=A0AAV5CFY8_ELECO|nr:hypothetical protein PR202_ga13892 [Eleusine coracana subsp. coracana]
MFWKGAIESKGGDCQVAWEVVYADKDEGGLGVRDLQTQNISLLLKLIHKVVSRADSPWVTWIHCQYAPFSTGFKTSPSYTASWNTIARLFPVYQAITHPWTSVMALPLSSSMTIGLHWGHYIKRC